MLGLGDSYEVSPLLAALVPDRVSHGVDADRI